MKGFFLFALLELEMTMAEEYKPAPDILYHYTSTESFVKIIESRNIRATRYDQMNDYSEIQLGVERLLEAVRRHETDHSSRDYKDFLISAIENYEDDTLEVYILSLSVAADSLDQWRAYAPRGGFAIGFDSAKVRKGFLCDITRKVGGQQVENPIRPNPANRLIRCRYTDKNGYLDLRSVVEERFFKPNSYGALFKRKESIAQSIFSASLSVMIYQTVCSIKHGAYASEMEWRCVNYRPDPDDYPVKLSETNRFYIEMTFDPKEFIKEVWISPHGDREACERAVAFFKQKDDLCFAIENSKIPFRG